MADYEQESVTTLDGQQERSPAMPSVERPGQSLVWRLLQGGMRDPAAIAAVLHHHPGARDQIVMLLQGTVGNQFVVQVLQECEKLAHPDAIATTPPKLGATAEGTPPKAEDPTVHADAPKGCITTDLRRSSRELQRLLEIGDLQSTQAALTALNNARRSREPAQLADEVVFFAGSDEYVLSVSKSVTDAMIPALQDRLATLHDESPADPTWDALAQKFNTRFKPVLNAFDLGPAPASAAGAPVAAARMRFLFTANQRDLLLGFFASNRIPEHLFNADDVGQTTAQQRILIASEILAKGEYVPGSEVQRVHALACYHWARIVYHYAGAATIGLNDGATGAFDHAGGALFATGKSSEPVHAKQDSSLVVPDQTPQAEANGDKAYRFANAPWDKVQEVEPGDWLYIYNANKSISGAHSVIFAGWVDEAGTDKGRHYRKAYVYGQSTDASGGKGEPMLLGDDYFLADGHSVHPVNQIKRVNEDAAPATSIEALSPKLSDKAATRLDGANKAFVDEKRKSLSRKGPTRNFRLDEFLSWLRDDNEGHIAKLAATPGRLTTGQVDLLRAANASTDDYDLVCLNQRLVSLDVNSDARDSKDKSANDGKETERAVVEGQRQTLRDEIAGYELELDTVGDKLEPLVEHLEEIDVKPELKSAVKQKRELQKKRQKLDRKKQAAEREQLEREIAQLTALIKELEATAHANATDVKKFGPAVAALEKRENELVKELRTAQDALTEIGTSSGVYDLVHPGGHAAELVTKVDGKFAHLAHVAWETFFVEDDTTTGER